MTLSDSGLITVARHASSLTASSHTSYAWPYLVVDILPYPTLSEEEYNHLQDQIASISEIDIKNKIFTPMMLEGEPPPREWVVEGFIPKGYVTGLFGPGGIGKSLLAQQLGTALASGKSWLGLPTNQSVVLSYFCEDDKDELWRRQIDINTAMNVSNDELGEFFIQSRPGMTNIMMRYEHGIGVPTEFFEQIQRDIGAFRADVVLLDNAAQLFGGNENDRREVTQFVNALHKLVAYQQVTIVLLGHPPKPTVNGQHEYSGSTAWDACFRSRLWFGKADNEEDDANEERILKKSKANYSSTGDIITVEWKKGFFYTKANSMDMVEHLEVQAKLKETQNDFLMMLDILTASGRHASHSPNAANYAPKLMRDMTICIEKKIKFKMLEKALTSLLNNGVLLVNEIVGYKPNRHPIMGIKRKIAVPQKEEK